MKTEKDEGYGYYSRVLNKPFDTVEGLKEAEAEYEAAHAAELKKAEERRRRAKEVEAAYKDAVDARKRAKEILAEANEKAAQVIKDAEGRYYGLRDAFVDDYGSFHMSYTGRDDSGSTIAEVLEELFNGFNF